MGSEVDLNLSSPGQRVVISGTRPSDRTRGSGHMKVNLNIRKCTFAVERELNAGMGCPEKFWSLHPWR